MAKYVIASQGHKFLVDDDDFQMISEFVWFKDKRGYAIANTPRDKGQKTTLKMHRIILSAKPGEIIDHINGDPSDNRKENLRIVTQSQNCKNLTTKRSNNSSGYKGVSWDSRKGKWMAKITVNYKAIYLGMYENKHDAAKAYNDAAEQYHGGFARLNTIMEGE
jgi:hypothetical protein